MSAASYRTSYGTDRPGNYANWSTHEGARFEFRFGAYGDTRVVVFGRSGHLEDALEEAASWLAANAPGHLMPMWGDEHKKLYLEASEELFPGVAETDLDDDQRQQADDQATADLTYTESGYLTSYEWTVDEDTDDRPDHHYVYGSGMSGYLYDNGPYTAQTLDDAIESVLFPFQDVVRPRELILARHALRTDGIYYFRHPGEAGAHYCDVSKEHEPLPQDDDNE